MKYPYCIEHSPLCEAYFLKDTKCFGSSLCSKNKLTKLYVHGSVLYHNTNRIQIANKMRPCSRIYYSNVIFNCSTCFEPSQRPATKNVCKTRGCNYSFWAPDDEWCVARNMSHDSCRQPQTYVKPEAAITVFELLMMSGVSLETCWAIKKHLNNKFYYTVACCLLSL